MLANFRMRQCQLDGGFQKTFLAATVITFAAVLEGIHRLLRQQAGNTIGQLDLAAHARGLAANMVENSGRQNIAASHRHAGRGYLWRRLFHHLGDFHEPVAERLTRHNAIAPGVRQRHLLNGQQRLLQLTELICHLRQNRRRAHHQVIGQQHRKWLIADQVFGA